MSSACERAPPRVKERSLLQVMFMCWKTRDCRSFSEKGTKRIKIKKILFNVFIQHYRLTA